MSFTFRHPKSLLVHGVLVYDTNKEEGRVRFHPAIPQNVVGLDILQDWIMELQEAYDKLRKCDAQE